MPPNKLTISLNGLVKEALVRRAETPETELARKARRSEGYAHLADADRLPLSRSEERSEGSERAKEPSTP